VKFIQQVSRFLRSAESKLVLPLYSLNENVRKVRLLFTFYRYYIWVSVFIDAACAFFLWKNGMGAYSSLFWFKLFTLGASFYFVNEYKKGEYYYFYNFGLSKKTLWISTLTFDLLLFFTLLILAYQLR
jgi:hypothetical protein